MKKLCFPLLLASALAVAVAVAGLAYRQQRVEQTKSRLTGAWVREQRNSDGQFRVVLSLNSGGDAQLSITGDLNGRPEREEAFGRWDSNRRAFYVDLTKVVPGMPAGPYGGPIVTLNEMTLAYQSEAGVENWRRLGRR
jgi:hypothetical protein